MQDNNPEGCISCDRDATTTRHGETCCDVCAKTSDDHDMKLCTKNIRMFQVKALLLAAKALNVIMLDPKLSRLLADTDPMAYRQAYNALTAIAESKK
jgi:hypothetical protein